MLYPYMKLADETEVVHSQLIKQDGTEKVIVHFERPTENGFDSARCELPDFRWVLQNGYSDAEISDFEELLRKNTLQIWEYASNKTNK
ncbi:hypothetical protein [Mediterraneibacter gnavus]|uniref:hypothetical protein n=1 Tax=Mediterraneibacter gnavus TaxID=33038 RepID=UPI0023303839|nr:hypothetical protein [Mediterraneibacter gnavus]